MWYTLGMRPKPKLKKKLLSLGQTIKIVTKIIHKKLPKVKVFLFGSRARGLPRPYSDIDIGLLGKEKINYKYILELEEEIDGLATFLEIQLVDLGCASEKFRDGVLEYAKRLI